MTQLRLLGLCRSLTRASNSTAVLRGLQDALAPKAALDIFSLHGLPLYNEDEDGEHAPESVRALRSAIETTDGVIMVSPEYNHGLSVAPRPGSGACMRRSATGASSTRPRCALRWQAWMTSSTRSGLRALFERRDEETGAMPVAMC